MAKARSILIVGQGSAGTRHRDVVAQAGHRVRTVSQRQAAGDFRSIAEAIGAEEFDTVAICSETSHHVADLEALSIAGYAGAIMVEKPICVDVAELDGLSARGDAFVAYNLRFLPVVRKLRDAIARDASPLVSAHLHVGQAMDTWRPGRSRDSSYSAFRDRGGGVLRDLSHELDLAMWLLGPAMRVAAVGGRYSEQTVDSDDAWSILAVCRECPQVSMSINGIDRAARRFISITTVEQTYRADLAGGVLEIGRDAKSVPAERNDSYRAMWRSLFNGGHDVCTFSEGVAVMGMIAAIEQASREQCWVSCGIVT